MDHKACLEELTKRFCNVGKPAIVINALSGETLEANHAGRQMTGYSIEELRRLKYQDIPPLKWHESEARRFEQVCFSACYPPVSLNITTRNDHCRHPAGAARSHSAHPIRLPQNRRYVNKDDTTTG